MERKLFTIDNFSGGQLSSLAEEKIPTNGALTAQNGYVDIDGCFVKRHTNELLEDIGGTDDRVKNYCLYSKSNGTKYDVLITHSESTSEAAKLYYRQHGVNATYTRWTTDLDDNFGKNYDVSLLSYKDVLWITDGDTHAYTWDGSTLTDITAGALWGEDYDDPLYLASAHGAIYLAGFASDPAAVYYSRYFDDDGAYVAPTSTDAWQATQIFKIEDTGEVITGIKGFQDKLVIFTRNYVYLLTGYISQYSNASLVRFYSDDGCISQNSIAEVAGQLMWVGKKGVYSFDGSSISITSQGIKDYFEWMDYKGIYKYTWAMDDKTAFDEFDGLNNADTGAESGSIVSSMYPRLGYATSYARDVVLEGSAGAGDDGFIVGYGQGGGVCQKIYLEKSIATSHLYIKFSYIFSDTTYTTMTLALSSSSDFNVDPLSDTDTYSTTTTLTGDGSEHEAIVDLGTVDLTGGSYYYIKFKPSISTTSTLKIKYIRGDFNNSNTTIYRRTNSSSTWTAISRANNTGLDVVMMPDNAFLVTDIKQIDNAYNIDRFIVDFDSNYNASDSSNTYAYRYSKTSATAGWSSWTSLANNSSLSSAISVSNESVWIQFRMYIYNDESELTYDTSSFKIDSIKLTYTQGSGVALRLFGMEYDKKYFVSIPEEGGSYNQKVFVFNGNAWTYYDLHTYCMWSQDQRFTYGLSDDNRIYQLNDTESVTTDDWNTETDWENYSLDNNCDDTTTSGSLQADLAGEYGDLFDDASIAAKWDVSDVAQVVESGGKVTFTSLASTAEWLEEDITLATSMTFIAKMDISGRITKTSGAMDQGAGIYFYDNVNSAAIELLCFTYAGTLFVDFVNNDGSATGTREAISSVNTIYLKIVRNGTSYTGYYSTDGLSFTEIDTIVSTRSFNRFAIENDNSYGASTDVLSVDYLIYPSDEYYRIYRYNTTGDATIYWESTNSSTTNKIYIYYASSIAPVTPGDETLDNKYNWTLLGTLTNTDDDNSTSFTTHTYPYLKFVFDNTDATYSPLLDRVYMISDEDVEMIWESPMMEFGSPDLSKKIRKFYIDAETDGGITLYYKTESMLNYSSKSVASTDKRISVAPEQGKKIQFKIVSDNALTCKLKHISMEYKESKLR